MIKKHISVQAKASLTFTIAAFLCKGINFITIPLFTRLLTTEEMGIATTYNSWYSLLVTFANLSLDSGSFNIAMMEFREDRYKYMSSILFLSTLATIVTSFVFMLFKNILFSIMGISVDLIWLMLLSFLFLPATSFWMLHQRYTYKYKSTAFVTLISTIMSVTISVISTYFAKINFHPNLANIRLISANTVLIVIGAFFYFFIFAKGKTGYNKKYWTFVFTVNTPLIIHTLAKHILDVSDRAMISNMVGKSEVGIYGVLYSISSISLIIWSAINSSLIPYMFEKITKGDTKDISIFIERILLSYSAISIFLTIIAPELVKIIANEEYYEAIYLMPPIAAGIFFTSLYNIYSNLLLYFKKTRYIMFATIVASVFNIITNYFFIRLLGYQAAAYTTLASYILLSFMQFLQLKKAQNNITIFNDTKIWCISIITCIICIMTNFLYKTNHIRYSIIGIVVIIFILLHKKVLKFLAKNKV